ncbi:hypothetical protein HK101_004240 [Irineochytrium annulatum]|nr:hypothetical protein HK101_004240 [Irineochytrium annulatum]
MPKAPTLRRLGRPATYWMPARGGGKRPYQLAQSSEEESRISSGSESSSDNNNENHPESDDDSNSGSEAESAHGMEADDHVESEGESARDASGMDETAGGSELEEERSEPEDDVEFGDIPWDGSDEDFVAGEDAAVDDELEAIVERSIYQALLSSDEEEGFEDDFDDDKADEEFYAGELFGDENLESPERVSEVVVEHKPTAKQASKKPEVKIKVEPETNSAMEVEVAVKVEVPVKKIEAPAKAPMTSFNFDIKKTQVGPNGEILTTTESMTFSLPKPASKAAKKKAPTKKAPPKPSPVPPPPPPKLVLPPPVHADTRPVMMPPAISAKAAPAPTNSPAANAALSLASSLAALTSGATSASTLAANITAMNAITNYFKALNASIATAPTSALGALAELRKTQIQNLAKTGLNPVAFVAGALKLGDLSKKGGGEFGLNAVQGGFSGGAKAKAAPPKNRVVTIEDLFDSSFLDSDDEDVSADNHIDLSRWEKIPIGAFRRARHTPTAKGIRKRDLDGAFRRNVRTNKEMGSPLLGFPKSPRGRSPNLAASTSHNKWEVKPKDRDMPSLNLPEAAM